MLVGFTQASTVIAPVMSKAALSGAVAYWLVPLKFSV